MSADINISNYEEFLLSYIDGELAGEELAALEQFLERHPAIKQELTLLESTKLQPEASSFSFGNKSLLYRGGPVHMGNYETYLLSYIDNELSPEDRGLFEQFLRQHPQVKQEMLLWHATRQHPDTAIVFENKALLYRQAEAKTRKLRPVYWWSAAAAVVAGLLIWQLPVQTGAPASQVAQQQTVAPATPVQQPSAVPVTGATTNNKQLAAATDTRNAGSPNRPTTPRTETVVKEEPAVAVVTPVASVSTPEPKLVTTEIVTAKATENNNSATAIGLENPAPVVKETIVASAPVTDKPQEAAIAAAPAPIQGELFMSVSSTGESKLMNGVTNVARFLSKKKK